jgi:hypothetical protein
MSKNPLDALAKLDKSRKSKTATAKKPAAPPPQLMLPLWPESMRGIPNAVLRGALFSVRQRRENRTKYTRLATLDGIEISFKGETFNQNDLDTLEMLLHLAREQPIDAPFRFTSHALLKELGRGTGRNQYAQLVQELERLHDSTIQFSVPGKADVKRDVFYGQMLEKYYRRERNDGTHEHVILFNEGLLRLYGAGYTNVDWQQRRSLTTSLAQWLHGFYATHAAPYDYRVETLKTLCGSAVERLGDFRKMVRRSMDELKAVGAITTWEITDADLVRVSKVPTLSQQRHIRKRAK